MPGLEVDLDLGPVEVLAGIRAGLSKLNDHYEAEARRRAHDQARARVPEDVRLFSSVTIPTPTARTGINMGGPQAGFYWLVRRLIVGGLTFKTTAAGTAEVYVTGLTGPEGTAVVGPIITALSLTDLVDQTPTLPNIAFYTSHQIIVQENENLMLVIDSGTAAQVYVAQAQIQNVRRAVGPEAVTAS